eukprot:TRINITY_DN5352_c0_g1_i1.p1 TRINITY_DN5352_c0_g1~~TRINITY_DN5352_c0_g1_i1.p1  ORF type:complete len:558 (+),score=169.32 TRINITY_DN5352_c0_g1_i1:51-1676(+)
MEEVDVTRQVQELNCEFDAPHFTDFNNIGDADDSWFEGRRSSARRSARIKRKSAGEAAVPSKTPRTVRSAPRPTKTPMTARSAKTPRSAWRPKLVQPESPQLLTNLRVGKRKIKSTEELQMERIQEEVEEVRKRRKQAEKSKSVALQPHAAPMPMRSTKQLTTPAEFHMETDKRFKSHVMQLRSDTTTTFVSTAQLVEQFQKKTPKRFRTNARGAKPELLTRVHFELTQPAEPHFATADRARPTTVLSTEEREAREFAQIEKFHALPLNKRVLQSNGELGVPRVPKQALTAPKTPQFKTKERFGPKIAPQEEEPKRKKVTRDEFGLTDPAPFSFATDERGAITARRTQQMLEKREAEERKARQFKAQPLPFMPTPAKPQHDAHLTVPLPFDLESERRHEAEVERLANIARAQAEAEAAARIPKARPILQVAPLALAKSQQPLTEISEFSMNSDRRAAKRGEFEEQLRAKDAALAEQRAAAESLQKMQAAEEVKELRKQLVHKALAVPKDAPFVAKPSNLVLTVPESPALRTKQRRIQSLHV